MVTNEPFLTIPCHYGQSADTAVLAYVRERLNRIDVALSILPSTYQDEFIHLMSEIFTDLIRQDETVTISRDGDGRAYVRVVKGLPLGKSEGQK